MINDLPERFVRFIPIFNQIKAFNPKGVSIVGSFGNFEKTPSPFSDYDVVFVFDTQRFFDKYSEIVESLSKNECLRVIELGVHYQFGYVVCIYYLDDPMTWVDIGIMDEVFAKYYMISKPKTDIVGSFLPSENREYPLGQMNHLARKILLSFKKKDLLSAKIFAYRYIGWKKVHLTICERQNGNTGLVGQFTDGIGLFSDDQILSYVIKDSCDLFNELVQECAACSKMLEDI